MRPVRLLAAFAISAVVASPTGSRPSTRSTPGPVKDKFARSENPPKCLLKPASDAPKHGLQKRGVQQSCSPYAAKIAKAFKTCSQRAANSLRVLQGKGDANEKKKQELMKNWFDSGANDQETVRLVTAHYARIKAECDQNGRGRVGVQCGPCGEGIAGETFKGMGPITLCTVALEDNSAATDIQGQDLGEVLLHEMDHVVGNTDDIAYDVRQCKQLSKRQSLDNAQSFTKFALATAVGDNTGGRDDSPGFPGVDPPQPGQPPSGPPPPFPPPPFPPPSFPPPSFPPPPFPPPPFDPPPFDGGDGFGPPPFVPPPVGGGDGFSPPAFEGGDGFGPPAFEGGDGFGPPAFDTGESGLSPFPVGGGDSAFSSPY
ncbi:Metallopeptidase, catalytic domain protein [Metarhizium album ARSEF 1941]|uniref:Metallopeptidase, catalytic domain protein n=1 Tax=Metarhizium album (strain ARSEF 1941) TaxID=1081103 RepID=A0A0B2WMW9_METAS|nr:Metallopeptidase, catalytic domain protein [Metarhizium album ARSEF 1941]KHN94832.1 Metallopeptidase, catalytic domain protein [Metarhizium album ARSEF 1941]